MRAAVVASYAEIVANASVAREHYVIALAAPEIAAAASPGQFAMLRVPGVYDPLLPRAFSFYGADARAGRVEFLYRVVGKGTRLLAAQRAGAALQIWGPLGRGFERTTGRAILVGGGVGIPPLAHFAQDAAGPEVRSAECAVRSKGKGLGPAQVVPRMEACFGFATAEFVVGEDRLQAAGVPLTISTDDGSRGRRGFVTDLLRERLTADAAASEIREPMTVFACGPHAMLAAVAGICAEFGVASQLALEAPMACGVGACIGCTVPRREGGYARVCTDGPVFRAEDIAWG